MVYHSQEDFASQPLIIQVPGLRCLSSDDGRPTTDDRRPTTDDDAKRETRNAKPIKTFVPSVPLWFNRRSSVVRRPSSLWYNIARRQIMLDLERLYAERVVYSIPGMDT